MRRQIQLIAIGIIIPPLDGVQLSAAAAAVGVDGRSSPLLLLLLLQLAVHSTSYQIQRILQTYCRATIDHAEIGPRVCRPRNRSLVGGCSGSGKRLSETRTDH